MNFEPSLLYSWQNSLLVPVEKEVEWVPGPTWMLYISISPAGNETTISRLQRVAQSLY